MMNRRNFVQLSGTGLAALLFIKHAHAFGTAKEMVHLPGKVFAKLDGSIHELTPSADKQTWSYKNIVAKLSYEDDRLKINIYSPSEALHNLHLEWQYEPPLSILGDHWERTYGDVHFQKPSVSRKLPWYFIQHDPKYTTCFGVKTGCNTICYWQVGEGLMRLTMDTTSAGVGVKLGDRVLHAADIIATIK